MKTCSRCGSEFGRGPRERTGRWNRRRFCSIECYRDREPEPLAIRFWRWVDRTGECWTWTGTTSVGYGHVGVDGRMVLAHRVAWELTIGPIPAGMFVLHRCDNPPCVRPSHLAIGTAADNSADMVAKGRHRNQFTERVAP